MANPEQYDLGPPVYLNESISEIPKISSQFPLSFIKFYKPSVDDSEFCENVDNVGWQPEPKNNSVKGVKNASLKTVYNTIKKENTSDGWSKIYDKTLGKLNRNSVINSLQNWFKDMKRGDNQNYHVNPIKLSVNGMVDNSTVVLPLDKCSSVMIEQYNIGKNSKELKRNISGRKSSICPEAPESRQSSFEGSQRHSEISTYLSTNNNLELENTFTQLIWNNAMSIFKNPKGKLNKNYMDQIADVKEIKPIKQTNINSNIETQRYQTIMNHTNIMFKNKFKEEPNYESRPKEECLGKEKKRENFIVSTKQPNQDFFLSVGDEAKKSIWGLNFGSSVHDTWDKIKNLKGSEKIPDFEKFREKSLIDDKKAHVFKQLGTKYSIKNIDNGLCIEKIKEYTKIHETGGCYPIFNGKEYGYEMFNPVSRNHPIESNLVIQNGGKVENTQQLNTVDSITSSKQNPVPEYDLSKLSDYKYTSRDISSGFNSIEGSHHFSSQSLGGISRMSQYSSDNEGGSSYENSMDLSGSKSQGSEQFMNRMEFYSSIDSQDKPLFPISMGSSGFHSGCEKLIGNVIRENIEYVLI